MTLRVYMRPAYDTPDRGEGGIRRVVEAMRRYLPEHGIEFTPELRRAHLAAGHGVIAERTADIPFVSHSHGQHWADYTWPTWAHTVNAEVTAALLQAQAITVPSRWVRGAFVRGLLRRPEVIYHGIEADEWGPGENQGYVLWNKGRADPVSDPRDMQRLAEHMPHTPFVTTVGNTRPNVQVIGVQTQPALKAVIQNAGVYLATARETFGVGTLEALASGVPVAGWDYGGQREIVVPGKTGYLAPYGNYDELAACVAKCFSERERLSANALDDIRSRWGWADKIEQYAGLYQRVAAGWHEKRPTVSVIVTCHDLGRYLPECLDSILAQDIADWECLIVDDWSSDGTPHIADQYRGRDLRFKNCRTPYNLRLSGARNFGARQALGRYLLFLDADDSLPPTSLGLLARSLEQQPEIHIVYGRLAVYQEGAAPKLNPWPDGEFDWRQQLAHNNQLIYAALQRREVWEEVGGYRERLWRAEDADYWCRASSFGFHIQPVTDHPTLIYRFRPDSKGQTEYKTYADKDGPWTEGFPWHMGLSYGEGQTRVRDPRTPNAVLVPFAAQGKPTINRGLAWNVYHREAPAVSVVIPVGPGHERHVLDALDSLIAQDVGEWEAIVVNDTGRTWTGVAGAPWARVISTDTKQGAGAARNLGIAQARAPLILFLDADDWLKPGALRALLAAYAEGDCGFVYGDYLWLQQDGRTEVLQRLAPYNQGEIKMQHGITILIAAEHVRQVGGFDETMASWEDWDFAAKLAVAGICGKHIDGGVFLYRVHQGERRTQAWDGKQATPLGEELVKLLTERYTAYYSREKEMGNCCPGGGEAILAAKRAIANAWSAMEGAPSPATERPGAPPPTHIRMEFIGETVGARTFHGPSGAAYRGGNNPRSRYVDALPQDVEFLTLLGLFRALPPPPPEPEPSGPALEAFPIVDRTAVEPPPEAPEGASAFSANGHGPHFQFEGLELAPSAVQMAAPRAAMPEKPKRAKKTRRKKEIVGE